MTAHSPCAYAPDDLERCGECRGAGGHRYCGNSESWCNANPMPGREQVKHGTIEWELTEEYR